MILWISGISGSGKTTIGKYFYQKFKRKNKNTIFIDGDEFRALFNNDLKYSLKDRDKNARRLTYFVKYLSDQKINIIIAANLTSQKYRNWCKKNLKNYLQIYIKAKLSSLKKRDYKKLYKRAINKRIKNVVGVDLSFNLPKNVDLYLTNDDTKKSFLKKTHQIKKLIKERNLKIF
tara:strand:- start:187 stop:711 length:525 start_codon:yes stop_codon:yes gene_type:complete